MEEKKNCQEPTLADSLENLEVLFEKFVTEWNKLVAMQKENLAAYDKLIKGGRA